MLRVAVDFGTSSTCVAVSVRGREPQVVVVDGQPLLSSAVYAGSDGTLFVGQEAERQAALDPSRFEPHPKLRVDEAELLLGDLVIPVPQVFRAVLGRAVAEARRVAGGLAVDQLVLTHPADWGGVRTQVLRQAATGLANRVHLVPEPVAAAVFHAASFPGPGRILAVLDLGGGTVDVSVVRTEPNTTLFTVLSTKGNPSFGGADVDQLLMEHLGRVVGHPEAWEALTQGRDLLDRRRRRVLRQDVRGAKETLSRHTYADIPLPSPFPDAHITRDDLERLIAEPIGAAVDLTLAAVRDAGLVPAQLSGIFLVGGASRIPLVARLVAERTGVVPVTLDQPETVVARGALRAVSPDIAHTGHLTGPRAAIQPGTGPLPVQPPQPNTGPLPVAFPVAPAKPVKAARGKTGLYVGIGLLLAVVGGGVGLFLALDGDDPAATTISRYDYGFTLPDGWTQTGGSPEIMRTEIKPTGAEKGNDLVLVQERELAFDSGTDRARALERLRSDYDKREPDVSDYDESASFGGRDVVFYREHLAKQGATVEWYVVLAGRYQVSIGCQYTEDGRDRVRQACETVVRSTTVKQG
ncbi:type VII secretion-associated protein [Actinokineospora globicatena]|uniref:type VII secretion-associated protein n=1 Tax=Actinokineospora globicatena TaxID=103729 RepID=UPI0020A23530|nr:type VII secretion-associated protein [Actinokineospora globicatena]MCP2301875.1 type VII secretion-associated protein, Rv3446c family, C-terminal domain-containing protein [Actinokineospora globicatena]GLW76466.1 type VII secretion-associated protein [Actinokineospora globicatena]GLW83301.1 type VII secretion-associated protein [Actinokineospora globicatena]